MPALYEFAPPNAAYPRGRLILNMHPGQRRAWDSRARFVFVFAGSQSGKTSYVPWWLCNAVYGWLDNRWGGSGAGDYIAVTATYDLFKLKLLPEMLTVFESVLGVGRYWAGDKLIELRDPETGCYWARKATDPMWGRIILRSAESKGGLESNTAQAAILDEVGQPSFKIDAWWAILRRLSLSQGRVLATTTLYSPNWLKSEVWEKWREGDPDFDVIQFKSTENPSFPRDEYERARRSMPDDQFKMFYMGEWGTPAGLIYRDFDDVRHLCEPFAIPPAWPRYAGVDFGGEHTATAWLARDPITDVYYCYRESLEGGKSTPQHVATQKAAGQGENVVAWYGGARSENQPRWDWAAAGIPVLPPPILDVEAGISRVIELLRTDRIRFFKSLKGLRDELGSYARKLDERGNPLNDIADKADYHRLDALRYVVAGATVRGAVGIMH